MALSADAPLSSPAYRKPFCAAWYWTGLSFFRMVLLEKELLKMMTAVRLNNILIVRFN